MVLEEKLNNEKTNGSEYLKLDIPSAHIYLPFAGGGGYQRYIHSCYAPFPQMAGKVVAELFIKHVIKTQ